MPANQAISAPSFLWHDYGQCLLATEANEIKVQHKELCVKEVTQNHGAYSIWFTLKEGTVHQVEAKGLDGSSDLNISFNDKPALITSNDIHGFRNCYSIQQNSTLHHYCFRGSGLPFDGHAGLVVKSR